MYKLIQVCIEHYCLQVTIERACEMTRYFFCFSGMKQQRVSHGFKLSILPESSNLNSYSASRDNLCTVGGDGGCRVGEVRAGTGSRMLDHKGFKLQ